MRRPASAPPLKLSVPMNEALAQSAPLAGLLQRVQASQARFAAVRSALPGQLASQASPGPLDDTGWTLLARNGAAAAKIKQCVPRLHAVLAEQGWPALEIRVKVHVSRGG